MGKTRRAIIIQVPSGLANAMIRKGAEVEVLRVKKKMSPNGESTASAHIQIGPSYSIRGFPCNCLKMVV